MKNKLIITSIITIALAGGLIAFANNSVIQFAPNTQPKQETQTTTTNPIVPIADKTTQTPPANANEYIAVISLDVVAVACAGLICFPMFTTKLPATIMLFVVGVFSMVTGVIWAIAGDMGGRAMSATVVGVLDWAVYMGAAIQASAFGFVQEKLGWTAIFVTIGALYIVLMVLTLLARKMKLRNL